MAQPVLVKNLAIGEGQPKIAIPLTAPTLSGLEEALDSLAEAPCDLAEWRGDCYAPIREPGSWQAPLALFRQRIPHLPLLFTIRTTVEGGHLEISTEDYVRLLEEAMDSGAMDLVDVELSRGKDVMEHLVNRAHRAGIKVVGSCHDFQKTPSRETLVRTLCTMQDLGCDLAKYAVMPQKEEDVLTLLAATLEMKEAHPRTPVITMAMGPMGAITRIGGGRFGSAVTFGTAGAASAPGQLPADLLAQVIQRV